MMLKLTILLSLFAVGFAATSYEGYQIWSIEKDGHNVVRELQMKGLEVLSEFKENIEVLVKPSNRQYVKEALERNNVQYVINTVDIQKLVEEERSLVPTVYDPLNYNTLEEIISRLYEIAATNDAATVDTFQFPTIEGNYQTYIVFEGGPNNIWIDCGIHAREWISPASCMWGVELFNDGTDERVQSLLSSSTVYIMPVWNPDGYNYTFAEDGYRFWRKNRNPEYDFECVGVDLNRNFDDNWGGASTSTNPCSDLFCGDVPASEVETQNGQDFFQALYAQGNFAAMYSIHSHGEMWLHAYGYTTDTPPQEEMDKLTLCTQTGVNETEAVGGLEWIWGPISTTIYECAGTTVDYTYSQVGVLHSYTLELRGGPGGGLGGFDLPVEDLPIACEETWAGLFPALECAIANP